jgi:hypothetical protein
VARPFATPGKTRGWSRAEDADVLSLSNADFMRKHTDRSIAATNSRRRVLRRRGQNWVADSPRTEPISTYDPATEDDFATFAQAVCDLEEDADEARVMSIFEMAQRISDIAAELAPSTSSSHHVFDDGLPIGVAFTGDWHLGGGGVDFAKLRDDLTIIANTDGLYAVGMGDYVDGVSIHSKASPALYDPSAIGARGLQNEVAYILAKRVVGKWLAIIDGNHDAWSEKHAAIGCTRDFAKALGAPYFHQGGGSVYATVGDIRYNLAVRHNAPGNSRLNTSNAQRRAFDEWPQWENCDAICLAHFHFNDVHQPPRKGGECAYLRSGTYKLRDPYAASGGFTPEWGIPMVILYPDRREVFPVKGNKFETGLRLLASEREFYRRKVA